MKYFLYANTMRLFSVPKKYWPTLAIIEKASEMQDDDVNDAINEIISNCKVKLYVSAVSQTL